MIYVVKSKRRKKEKDKRRGKEKGMLVLSVLNRCGWGRELGRRDREREV